MSASGGHSLNVEPGTSNAEYDLVVVGDQVVVGERVVAAGIAVKGERIAALLEVDQARRPGLAARTIDAGGKVVLPGPIDAHVHQRPLNDAAASCENVTRPAGHRGVTTMLHHSICP